MPGLPRGLPRFEEFVPHINIIIGPNASGKSSTARGLRDLIWRRTDGELSANAVASLEGRDWQLSVDGHRASSRVNGEELPLPAIPVWDAWKRYTLAMDELLAAQDGDLAQEVVKASTGYDLRTAEGALGYTLGLLSTNTTLYRTYTTAKAEYDVALERQQELARQQQGLRRLRDEKAASEAAVELLSWNRLFLEYLRAKERFTEAESSVTGMPDVLAELSGREYDELGDLKLQLETLEKSVGEERRNIEKAWARRVALRVPDSGVEEGLTGQLQEKIDRWLELERKLFEAEQDLAAAVGREQEALKRLGAAPGAKDWHGVTAMEVSLIDEDLQHYHQLASRRAAIEEVILALARSRSAEGLPSPEKLSLGIHMLVGWLQDARSTAKSSIADWSIWLLAGLGVVAVILTVVVGRLGLICLLLIGAGLLISLLSRKKQDGSAAELRRSDYERLGLPAPASWTLDGVEGQLKELAEKLGQSSLDVEIGVRVLAREDELLKLKPEETAMQERYDQLRAAVQLLPKTPDGDISSFDGMYWFVRYAGEWSTSRSERVGWEETIRVGQERQKTLIEEINSLFKRALAEPVEDSAAAKSQRGILVAAEGQWKLAGIAIENAETNIASFRERQIEVRTKIAALYDRMGLVAGEEAKLKELVGQVAAYREAVRRQDQASGSLLGADRAMQNHSLFESRRGEADRTTIIEVEGRLAQLAGMAERLGVIGDEIARIYADIRVAEGGNSMETLLKKKEDSVAALEAEYDQRLASITGRLLTETLKKEADERERPAVFMAADALFSRITRGQYRLRLRGTDPPAFTAFETIEHEERELDELSTGTRIQLLLAVRLAFIDSQEDAVSIPIMADELLANSDQRRSMAIMEALTEISRQGRQLFYFTAQEEEVKRWEGFLADKPDISRKIIVLRGDENEEYASQVSVAGSDFVRGPLLGLVPEPGGLDHDAYGALLDKGHFDPMVDSMDRLHVWYLFESPAVVYSLLMAGLDRWGAVQAYRDAGGDLAGVGASLFDQADQKVAVFGRFLELYRQGRSYRVDRIVLGESGAVSGKFIDAVSDQLLGVDYDPVRLLAALEHGEVVGFRGSKIEQLREFLVEEGYISEDNMLSPEELWVTISAFVSQRGVAMEEVKRMTARVLRTELVQP